LELARSSFTFLGGDLPFKDLPLNIVDIHEPPPLAAVVPVSKAVDAANTGMRIAATVGTLRFQNRYQRWSPPASLREALRVHKMLETIGPSRRISPRIWKALSMGSAVIDALGAGIDLGLSAVAFRRGNIEQGVMSGLDGGMSVLGMISNPLTFAGSVGWKIGRNLDELVGISDWIVLKGIPAVEQAPQSLRTFHRQAVTGFNLGTHGGTGWGTMVGW
jgi:hypothetical protein